MYKIVNKIRLALLLKMLKKLTKIFFLKGDEEKFMAMTMVLWELYTHTLKLVCSFK